MIISLLGCRVIATLNAIYMHGAEAQPHCSCVNLVSVSRMWLVKTVPLMVMVLDCGWRVVCFSEM